MGSPASNGRAYRDGIINRRGMPCVISKYLPAFKGPGDEVGNHTKAERDSGFQRFLSGKVLTALH